MPVSPASTQDIPALVTLINTAYRGETSKKGWTAEANLLKGELRTDVSSLTAVINKKEAVMKLFEFHKIEHGLH